jgi:hypothetical protein
MPVTPWVGYKPWTWVKSHQYVGYTSMFNLLNWPSLVIPVTRVSKELDEPVPQDWLDHHGRNPSDEFNKQQCESLPPKSYLDGLFTKSNGSDVLEQMTSTWWKECRWECRSCVANTRMRSVLRLERSLKAYWVKGWTKKKAFERTCPPGLFESLKGLNGTLVNPLWLYHTILTQYIS